MAYLLLIFKNMKVIKYLLVGLYSELYSKIWGSFLNLWNVSVSVVSYVWNLDCNGTGIIGIQLIKEKI
jgi:hypothetical protein